MEATLVFLLVGWLVSAVRDSSSEFLEVPVSRLVSEVRCLSVSVSRPVVGILEDMTCLGLRVNDILS